MNPAAAKRFGWPAAVFALTAACLLPTLANDFVNWDDRALLTANLRYRGLAPEQLGWMFTTTLGGHYQPLAWVSFGLDYRLWGMRPAGYHLTSVLLHAAAAVVFYYLLVELLKAVRPAAGAPLRSAAALGALAFGMHPLRVESVAWATERGGVLSGLWLLAAVLAYLRMQPETGGRRRATYALSVFCYAASLLAKAWGMTLPVVLLLLDVYPLRRFDRGRYRQVLVEKLPFAALAVAAGTVAGLAKEGTGAMIPIGQYSLLQRAAQACTGLLFYPAKTLLPVHLSPLYPLDQGLSPTSARSLLSFLGVLAATGLLLALRRRWPWALAAWLAYGVMLSPVLGFAQTGPQAVADRYSYLACLPWAALLGAAAQAIWSRQPPPATARLSRALAAALVGTLGVVTAAQSRLWQDSLTLWDHALRLDAANAVAYSNRGSTLYSIGDYAGALADYDEAVRRLPSFAEGRAGRSLVRWAMGDFPGALADGEIAARLAPGRATSFLARGLAKLGLGDARGAFEDFDASLRLDPFGADGYNNRGLARQELGDLAGAVADFGAALDLATRDRARYLTNRGLARQELGDLGAGLADLDQAVREDPSYLRGVAVRGRARLAAGDVRGALADLRRALELAPADWASRSELEAQVAQLQARLAAAAPAGGSNAEPP
jgi:tetratricopeptide (TPR) repeat protein